MAFVYEISERALLDNRHISLGQNSRAPDGRCQRLRQHQKSDARHRKQNTPKVIAINHRTGAVHALHRRYRSVTVAEFTIEVILDNEGIMRLGPLKKLAPAALAHHDTGGIVVRWRYPDNANGLIHALELIYDQSLLVYGNAVDDGAMHFKRQPDGGRSRILHRDVIAFF